MRNAALLESDAASPDKNATATPAAKSSSTFTNEADGADRRRLGASSSVSVPPVVVVPSSPQPTMFVQIPHAALLATINEIAREVVVENAMHPQRVDISDDDKTKIWCDWGFIELPDLYQLRRASY